MSLTTLAVLRDFRAGVSMDMLAVPTVAGSRVEILAYFPRSDDPKNYTMEHLGFHPGEDTLFVAEENWAKLLKKYRAMLPTGVDRLKDKKKLWVPFSSKGIRNQFHEEAFYVDRTMEAWLETYGERTVRRKRWRIQINWFDEKYADLPTMKDVVPILDATEEEARGEAPHGVSDVDVVYQAGLSDRVNELWSWVIKVAETEME